MQLNTHSLNFLNKLIPNSLDKNIIFHRPEVNFGFREFEPYISGEIMELHITKHHLAYVKNVNKIIETSFSDKNFKTSEDIISFILENKIHEKKFYNDLCDDSYFILKNNFFGHLNHSFLWSLMTSSMVQPSEFFLNRINENFNSWHSFIEELKKKSLKLFASGWVWLVADKTNNFRLSIVTTQNQDHVWYIDQNLHPILGIDMWEHAYYIDYVNDREQYFSNFITLINWKRVEEYYSHLKNEI